MKVRWLAALAASTLLACGDGEAVTEILVVVDSDMDALREVAVAVEGLDGEQTTGSARLSERGLPRVLGVVHEGGPLGPTTIAAFGIAANDRIVVEQRFEVSFVQGKTLRLDMMLSESCVLVHAGCEEGTTCIDGACEPNDEVELKAWTGPPERPPEEEPDN